MSLNVVSSRIARCTATAASEAKARASGSHSGANGTTTLARPLRVDQLHDADDVPVRRAQRHRQQRARLVLVALVHLAIEERPQQVVGVGILDVQRGAGQRDVRRQARLAQRQRPGLQATAQLAGAEASRQRLVLHDGEAQVVVVDQEDRAGLGAREQARLLQDVVEHGLHAQLGAERRRDPDEANPRAASGTPASTGIRSSIGSTLLPRSARDRRRTDGHQTRLMIIAKDTGRTQRFSGQDVRAGRSRKRSELPTKTRGNHPVSQRRRPPPGAPQSFVRLTSWIRYRSGTLLMSSVRTVTPLSSVQR